MIDRKLAEFAPFRKINGDRSIGIGILRIEVLLDQRCGRLRIFEKLSHVVSDCTAFLFELQRICLRKMRGFVDQRVDEKPDAITIAFEARLLILRMCVVFGVFYDLSGRFFRSLF
ncbi:hypothetical protein XalbCFBP2523_01400 [Xanthomonas albilineans]|nr:hypothetical protein XalbCFBP2523_01400 [Xanthomonas albilineans]